MTDQFSRADHHYDDEHTLAASELDSITLVEVSKGRYARVQLVHQLVLVTENATHFKRISGLTLDNWRR